MRQITISELRKHLTRHLRLAAEGESIEIVDRGRPVARRIPVGGADANVARLARMVRAGIVTAPRERLDVKAFLRKRPIPCRGDAVQAVIDGRGDR